MSSSNSADNLKSRFATRFQLDEQWGAPGLVVAGGSLASLLVAFSCYYTVIPLFREIQGSGTDGEGILHSSQTGSSWYSTGSGFVLCLIVGLFILCASTCIGLTFSTRKDSIIFSLLTAFVLAIAFNFAFRSVNDLISSQFLIWTIIAVIVGLGGMIYSIMQVRTASTKAKKEDIPKPDDLGLSGRSNYIYGLSVVGVISGLLLLHAHWEMHSKINETLDN